MVPWGNAYYNSALLDGCPSSPGGQYNRDRYTCWAEKCNATATAPELCWNGTKLCQHGTGECAGDSLEACAISVYPSPTLYTPFVYCFEQSCVYNSTDPFASHCDTSSTFIEGCAAYAGIDAAPLVECFADADRVAALDLVAAKATAALGTSKEGTPWVLVNGQPLDDPSTLLASVCDTWAAEAGSGDTTPAGCTSKRYDWASWQEAVTLAAGLAGGLLLSMTLVCLCRLCRSKKASSRHAPLLDAA